MLLLGLLPCSLRAGEDVAGFCGGNANFAGRFETPMPEELRCLAMNVYFEARRSNDDGQTAVAHVVLNRVAHGTYAPTICGVVQQSEPRRGCQFSWWCDGRDHAVRDPSAWRRAVRNSCRAVSRGAVDMTKGALIYHATTVLPDWASGWKRSAIVGGHVFYVPLDR